MYNNIEILPDNADGIESKDEGKVKRINFNRLGMYQGTMCRYLEYEGVLYFSKISEGRPWCLYKGR